VDAFEQFARGGLQGLGLDADDVDLQIMRYVDEIFGPELRALLAEDFNAKWPETDMDPSRAPSS
jgi:hypothetical protein